MAFRDGIHSKNHCNLFLQRITTGLYDALGEMQSKESCFLVLQRFSAGLYDAFGVIISVSDVLSDVLLAYDYFITGKTLFFIAACVIFFITQISYTLLFLFNYFPNPTARQTVTVCLCVFPFAQFVPVCVWLDSLHVPSIRRFYRYMGLQPLNKAPDRINFQSDSFDKVLMSWIRSKAAAHFGFIVEAILEAFPQCILQMACIIYYQEVSPIAMYSIFLSLTTVASKGVVISFSINPVVFAFNFCCILLDILGFFATLTWICYQPAQHTFVVWIFWLQLKIMFCLAFITIVLILAGIFVVPLASEAYEFVLNTHAVNLTWRGFFRDLFRRGVVPLARFVSTKLATFLGGSTMFDVLAFYFVAVFILSLLIAIPCVIIMLLQIFNLLFLELMFVVEEFRNSKKTGFTLAMTYILAGADSDERGKRFAALLAASKPELQKKRLPQMLHECSTKTIRRSFWGNIFWRPRRKAKVKKEKAGRFLDWVMKVKWDVIPSNFFQIILAVYVFILLPGSLAVSLLINIFLPVIAIVLHYESAVQLHIYMSYAYSFVCFCALCLLPYAIYFRYWQFHVGRSVTASVRIQEVERIRNKMTHILKIKSILNDHFRTDIASLVGSYLPDSLESCDYPATPN